MYTNNNNNNNCLKSNIQCIEIRVQWTVHLGSSHMHVLLYDIWGYWGCCGRGLGVARVGLGLVVSGLG